LTDLINAIHAKNKEKVIALLTQGVDATVEQPWMVAKLLRQEVIADLLPKAFDEFFLILFLKLLNYKISSKGICFGFSHMAKQAIAARQTAVFNERLIFLAELYFDIEKQTLLAMKPEGMIERSDHQFQQSFKVNFLHALDLLRDSDNQKYIDIIAFFDGIYLYQKHPNRCSIFAGNHYFANNRSAQQTAKIVSAKNIEYRGQFSGAYSKEMLHDYLQIFQFTHNDFKFQQPVSLILTSVSHAMIIAYDSLTRQWTYGDSGNMPLKTTNDICFLSEKMISTFSHNQSVIFTTSFYAASEDRKLMEIFMRTLLQNPEWEKMHAPNARSIEMKCGKEKKYRWEQIASGVELKAIRKVHEEDQVAFLRYCHFPIDYVTNRLSLFVANKTRGKYEKEYDENDEMIPVYQVILKNK